MSHPIFDITDRVVLLTGAAGLIGRCYVSALVQAGARVVLADIDAQSIKMMAQAYDPQCVFAVPVDVSKPESVREMIAKTLEYFGRIDGLVNNAAIDPKADPEQAHKHQLTFENYPIDLWQKSIDVNITGMFLCAQAAASIMVSQRRGVIINISSIYGRVGPDQRLYEKDQPESVPFIKPPIYSVSKAAVYGLTKYLATYYAGQGIRVNTLTLGGVYNGHDEDFVKRYTWRVPLQRMANADEYNGALIFLLSDASSYMTGADLVIDGGWTAW